MPPRPIPWTDIKVLTFDIFGTLIDWESGIWNAVQATSLAPYIGTRSEALALLERHDTAIQAERPTALQRDVIAEGLRRAAAELRVVEDGKLSAADVEAAAVQYGGAIGGYGAFGDTVAAIQRLGRRYKLVPLTNVDNRSFEGTLGGGLKGCRFDAIYTAEDIGSYKPDLRNFRYMMEHLGTDLGIKGKEEVCHVAQSLFHDHRPAKEFGFPYRVWVDRKGHMGNVKEGEHDGLEINLRVETLAELADIADQAFEKA